MPTEEKMAEHSLFHRRGPRMLTTLMAIATVSLALLAFPSLAAPLDSTPPVVDLVDSDGRLVKNGTLFGSGNITITCLSQDDLSEITSVEYSIDGSDFESATSTDGLHRTTIALTGLEEGNHSIVVRITNNASLSTEKGATFVIDSAAYSQSMGSVIWIALGAMAAVSGIILALVVFLRERGERPGPAESAVPLDRLPPIF